MNFTIATDQSQAALLCGIVSDIACRNISIWNAEKQEPSFFEGHKTPKEKLKCFKWIYTFTVKVTDTVDNKKIYSELLLE